MTEITGTVYKPTNAREKVTYGYVKLEDGRNVDVIAFPAKQTLLSDAICIWNVDDSVTLRGEIKTNEKSVYALQFFASEIVNAETTPKQLSYFFKRNATGLELWANELEDDGIHVAGQASKVEGAQYIGVSYGFLQQFKLADGTLLKNVVPDF